MQYWFVHLKTIIIVIEIWVVCSVRVLYDGERVQDPSKEQQKVSEDKEIIKKETFLTVFVTVRWPNVQISDFRTENTFSDWH